MLAKAASRTVDRPADRRLSRPIVPLHLTTPVAIPRHRTFAALGNPGIDAETERHAACLRAARHLGGWRVAARLRERLIELGADDAFLANVEARDISARLPRRTAAVLAFADRFEEGDEHAILEQAAMLAAIGVSRVELDVLTRSLARVVYAACFAAVMNSHGDTK
jgi:hypothetical protein